MEDGTLAAKIPGIFCFVSEEKPRRRRVGRSEALRIVGLLFSICGMVVRECRMFRISEIVRNFSLITEQIRYKVSR